ncbi:hypothetical protein Bca4012_062897 [Brassica carinata]
MKRLANTVSDWKIINEQRGYEARANGLTKEVWDGLIRYWHDPHSIRIASQCSTSRMTRDEDGFLPIVHTTGNTPHAAYRLYMAKKNNGVLPLLPDLFRATHSRGGVFADPRSEKIHGDVTAQIAESVTQLTQQSPDGVPVELSTVELDNIYEEVVPKKKGRIVGIGSVNDVPRATSAYAQRQDIENARLQQDLTSTQASLSATQTYLTSL